jgi:hypothetical protein
MPIELEAAVADSLSTSGKAAHAPPPGTPCANCDTPLTGLYCSSCGQSSDNHHRSILHLIWEVIEDMFHLDGRLLRTVPDLFLRPGRLARDYMEGRIARHVPPFRAFLVSLLLYMFAAEHVMHQLTLMNEKNAEAQAEAMKTPQGRAKAVADLRKEAQSERNDALTEAKSELKEAQEESEGKTPEGAAAAQKAYAEKVARADAALAQALKTAAEVEAGAAPARTTQERVTQALTEKSDKGWKAGLRKAVANPEYFLTVMFGWGHRLAVLLLPIVGLTLALVYRNRPKYFIYDHMLVAMNVLTFTFLTNAVGLIMPFSVMPWVMGLVALWTPVNLFQTLRGAYESSILGSIFKTLTVWLTTVLAFSVLLGFLMMFTLSQL